MEILKRHVDIDMRPFEEEVPTITRYGLPLDVKFCKKCVISNQRPNSVVEIKNAVDAVKPVIHFNKGGMCDACEVVEEKNNHINWEERERELRDLCDRYRRSDGRYDCIVPGSGGKDSFFTSYKLKYKYGMHPLTVTWAPHLYTSWGYRNFQEWIASGMDNFLITPNSKTHRLLTRLATEVLLHPFQPFFIGQKNIAPKLAAQMNIPLIFYGENQAEYGNPKKENDRATMNPSFFSLEDKESVRIGGVTYRELMECFGIDNNELDIYLPITSDQLKEHDIQVHYLGYYEKWHPQEVYYFAVENGGFRPSPERSPGTYTKYSSIDDKMDDLNFYTTFIKFGIGRATYDAAQEIRHGEITRDEGVALVQKYDGEWPERFEEELWDYLSIMPEEYPLASKMFEEPRMDKEYFLDICNRFRSPHIWKYQDGKWILRKAVYGNSIYNNMWWKTKI